MIDRPHDVAVYHLQHQERVKREREEGEGRENRRDRIRDEGRENRRDRIRDEGRKDNEFKVRN